MSQRVRRKPVSELARSLIAAIDNGEIDPVDVEIIYRKIRKGRNARQVAWDKTPIEVNNKKVFYVIKDHPLVRPKYLVGATVTIVPYIWQEKLGDPTSNYGSWWDRWKEGYPYRAVEIVAFSRTPRGFGSDPPTYRVGSNPSYIPAEALIPAFDFEQISYLNKAIEKIKEKYA